MVTALNHVGSSPRAATYLIKPDGFGDLPTIHAALEVAAAGDSVVLADGEFEIWRYLLFPGVDIVFSSQSRDPFRSVIISHGDREALNFSRGQSAGTVLEYVTIRDASNAEGNGGGVLCYGSSPTIRHCSFRNNQGAFGGGIACYNASPTIEGCLFEGNMAGGYGYAGWGGGVSVVYGTPRIIECTFAGNRTFGTGAGVDIQVGSAQIVDCVIMASDGSGICCSGGQAEIVDCVIVGTRGEGVKCNNASVTIRNATIAGCNGYSEGGGVLIKNGGTLSAERTVIWGNCSDAGFGNVSVLDTSVATFDCCIVDSSGVGGGGSIVGLGDGTFSDPLFCSPAPCTNAPTDEGDYRVAEISPCTPERSPCGSWIGALESGCAPPAVEPRTWGAIKAMFRQ